MSPNPQRIPPTEEFRFRSPGPGAYRVRLVGSDAGNTTSLLLSGEQDVATVSLPPGIYTAIIEPIGASEPTRQPVELRHNQQEPVQLSDTAFAERRLFLSAATGTFATSGASAQLQFRRPSDLATPADVERREVPSDIPAERREAVFAAESREFSLGLSVRDKGDSRRRWKSGTLPVTISDEPGRSAVIILRRPSGWTRQPEWRLTAAVAGDRRWRMRVPLFRGGVQVLLLPAVTPAGLDLAVSMTPRNPGRGALVANLEQMFLSSGSEVIRSSLPDIPRKSGNQLLCHLLAEGEDPWTILAAALLMIRSQEAGDSVETLRQIAGKWTFVPDMAVMRAWAAASAEKDAPNSERQCLRHLRSIAGHPYFAASQALGLELLTGLALGGSSAELRAQARAERDRWARVSRRQVISGAFLGWEDSRPAHTHDLDRTDYFTIARGRIEPDRVELVAQTHIDSPTGARKVPALERKQTDPDDPWKGRFGGSAERSGYRLAAQFRRGPDAWVEVTILVRALNEAEPARHAELFLHDSFRPDRVTVEFVDGVATYTVLAWGGFTVGAWIPRPGIELELDLSGVEKAPVTVLEY